MRKDVDGRAYIIVHCLGLQIANHGHLLELLGVDLGQVHLLIMTEGDLQDIHQLIAVIKLH